MNHHELYSMKNFDFLALSFARMHAQGHYVDLQAIVGNMDEDHRESMPKGLRDLGEDVEKKIRQVLQSQLTRLDLVSREEFDVQTQVLLRTREKLALLEQRLSELESRNAPEEVKPAPAIPPVDDQA